MIMERTMLVLLSTLIMLVSGVVAGPVVVSSNVTASRGDGIPITGSYTTTINGRPTVGVYTTTYFPAAASTPVTWASVGDYATKMATVSYTVITRGTNVMRVPVTTWNPDPDPESTAASSSSEEAPSKGSNHLGLIVALPVTLGIASLLVGALFLIRKRNRAEQRRRVNHWASRMAWIPDRKEEPSAQEVEWDPSAKRPTSYEATPLSPLQPAHQRQKSIG